MMSFYRQQVAIATYSYQGAMRLYQRFLLMCVLAGLLVGSPLGATPPFGHPDQPYDRLPGTLQTSHVPWARPLAGGKLAVLFVCPYNNSREVVELAQRLDVNATVIMSAGHTGWSEGYFEGTNATPLQGVEAKSVLEKLSRQRLALENHYDAIVIGKLSWQVIPAGVRDGILAHVERGTGLVYLSPNRLKAGWNRREVADDKDPEFSQMFEGGSDHATRDRILAALPIDIMPLQQFENIQTYRPLPAPRHQWQQAGLRLSSSTRGKGRILGIDYLDEMIATRMSASLTPAYQHPRGDHDEVIYDLSHALLARGILWAVDRLSNDPLEILIDAPATDLTEIPVAGSERFQWRQATPETVVERVDLPRSQVIVKMPGDPRIDRMVLVLRERTGHLRDHVATEYPQPEMTPSRVIVRQDRKIAPQGSARMTLPMLSRGTYLLNVQALDKKGAVVDFACRSFRVESVNHVTRMETDAGHYQAGGKIQGTIEVAEALQAEHAVEVTVYDMWGRRVYTGSTKVSGERAYKFSVPVNNPLSELWDVQASIVGPHGVVDHGTLPVPILNNTFDEYMFMLIFSPTPGRSNWKGALHARQLRRYGINATYTYLIYSDHGQYFHNAREHLRSVAYAEHSGEYLSPADHQKDFTVENHSRDLAEISRMLRHVAETGEKLDSKEFPYRMGYFSADWLNNRLDQYRLAGRFGSPFYTLTGENYLLGEFKGRESSGFGKTTTRRFQQWCREQYHDDLAALNREWGSELKRWEDVRGIMLEAAVEQDQLPRWVDFRYFMRSQVWSQFFIDWTDMMRQVIPNARTGRVGHDHHDFTRYRKHMASSKLYVGQEKFAEWRHALTVELPASFGNDEGFLLAPQSMIRWTHDLESATNRRRWPWMVLMMGLDGFDWERGLHAPTLGGEHAFTPDYSEPLPYFRDISNEVLAIQRGIGKLTMAARPERSRVAILWAPYNHYISRCLPFEENGFSGTWMSNVSVIGGAVSDSLSLLQSLQLRPTIVAPEDVIRGDLARRGFKVLVLPYNKGMSPEEAVAIRRFVATGGLVIADNDPATYSQHGRKLKQPALADLFPVTDRVHTQGHGKGQAAYLPNVINGYTSRLEKDDDSGADVVQALLTRYAGERPSIELLGPTGQLRHDTLLRVYRHGETRLVGLLRAQTPAAEKPVAATLKLPAQQHAWDVRQGKYLGYSDAIPLQLDQDAKFLALLPEKPVAIDLAVRVSKSDAPARSISAGSRLEVIGKVGFSRGSSGAGIGQAVHVQVFAPDGEELEWFRGNVVFQGSTFRLILPLSQSARSGAYRVVVKHALSGTRGETVFQVGKP
jgi:hypothetical protein